MAHTAGMAQGRTQEAKDRTGRMIENRDVSLTFLKGMSVLKVFDETRTHMTLADIARHTGLDPAAARRMVLTLVQLGYVKKENRLFSLTPRVLVLAAGFLRGNQFGTLVQPVLNSYATDLGLDVSVAIMDDDHALLLAQSTLRGTNITYGFTVGSRLPVRQTALGRMLLASGAAGPLETKEDSAEISRSITKAARLGYCVADGTFEAGVTGIAVPIRSDGATPAVLGVSALTSRLADPNAQMDIIDTLRRGAAELARANLF